MGVTEIYRGDYSDHLTCTLDNSEYDFREWKPVHGSFLPPGKGFKYLLFWVFHHLRIFKNRDYSSVFLYDGEVRIASLLVVPAYYKWPFMQKDDLQFTYVMTNKEYRGKGIGEKLLRFAVIRFRKPNRNLWYVTDSENPASVRLCTKVGFKLYAQAKHSLIFKIIKAVD